MASLGVVEGADDAARAGWPQALEWAAALGLFLLAALLRFGLMPVEGGSTYFTFYPATIAAFYFLGRRPATLTLLLSAATGYWVFAPPHYSLKPSLQSVLPTLTFLVSCGAIGVIVARLRRVSRAQHVLLRRVQSSREELDAILSAQSEVIGRAAADGTVLYVNDAYCRQLGVRREEVLGRSWRPRVAPEDLAEVERQLAQMSPARPDVTIENRVLLADGRQRWYQFANHGEFDAQGRLTVIQAVGRDVTERRVLQDTLARRSAELRDLFDNAPCGYHSLDDDGRFALVNATEARWLGLAPEQLVRQRRLAEFLTDEGRVLFAGHFADVLAGRAAAPVEVDLVVAGQPARRVIVSTEPGLDASGHRVRTRGVMHDITDLSRARQAAQRLLAEQTAMLENELVGIARLRDRQVVWNNRTFERIFGHAAGELLNQPTSALYVDPRSYERVGREAYVEITAGRIYRTQVQMRHHDGSPMWVDAMGTVFDADTRETLWLLIDITQQKQAEQLRLQAVQLEAENRQLRELGRVQREFVAGVSHEMRTPLNGILGLAHLVERFAGEGDAARLERLGHDIGLHGTALLGMVDRVLAHASAASGRLALQSEALDVTQLLERVHAACKAAARERGQTLRLEPPAAPLVLHGDLLRLLQALQALVNNAVKFGPEGSTIALRARPEGDAGLRIEVQDQGPGIAPERHEAIFESFNQASSGADGPGGLGLGLALAHRIVQAHGGRIELQSAPGRGSCFAVLLPLQAGRDDA